MAACGSSRLADVARAAPAIDGSSPSRSMRSWRWASYALVSSGVRGPSCLGDPFLRSLPQSRRTAIFNFILSAAKRKTADPFMSAATCSQSIRNVSSNRLSKLTQLGRIAAAWSREKKPT